MTPTELTPADIGQVITIATKVKSRPRRGTLQDLQHMGKYVRVQISGSFGSKWHVLTDANEINLGES